MEIAIVILLALILIQITRIGGTICRNQVKIAAILSGQARAIR